MASISSSDIDARVHRSLLNTNFNPYDFERLPGGSVNWVYLAKLSNALNDGTTEVLVKHGETQMATKPEFPLTLFRCV